MMFRQTELNSCIEIPMSLISDLHAPQVQAISRVISIDPVSFHPNASNAEQSD